MFGLFVALFGGLYYGARYVSDKAASERADREIQANCDRMKNDLDQWRRKMVDKDLEFKIQREINMGQHRETIDKVVNGVFDKAKSLGYDMRDVYNRPYQMVDIYPKYRILIMMALRGKLPADVAECGIKRPWQREVWKFHDLFMEWLDKELQSHGVEPMLFQGKGLPNMKNTGVKTLARSAPDRGGTYCWWPMRMWVFTV